MRLVYLLVLLAMPTAVQAAEIKALVTIAVKSAFDELGPAFEASSGQKLAITYTLGPLVAQRVADGEAADFLVATRSGVDGLLKSGKVRTGDDAVLVDSRIGVAVRADASRPDISTPQALVAALRAAKSIGYTDPAAGGPSGVHVAKILERLNIADEMRSKTRHPPPGGFVAELLLSGQVDLAIQQYGELTAPGIAIVGPLPGDLQNVTRYVFAIPAGSLQPHTARAFLSFLKSPLAAKVFAAKGLDVL